MNTATTNLKHGFSTHDPQYVVEGKHEYYFEMFSKIGMIFFAILVCIAILGEGAFYSLKRSYKSWKSKQAETRVVLI